MSIEIADAATPRFGWIVSQTFMVIGRRFAGIASLTVLLACAPELLVSFIPASQASSGLSFATGALSTLYSGSLALITYHELAGDDQIAAQAAFSGAGSRFGVLLGASILSGLAVFGGLLLFVLPGLFLTTAWMPLTSVVVVERLGVTASLGRAWRLTEGLRWMLGGLLALYLTASVLLFGLMAFALAMMETALGQTSIERVGPVALFVVVAGALSCVGAVGSAVAYVALRRAKDGVAADVASVFA